MRYVILGTAGHIDHGKSTLVKALTGTDPDRLKEEKERGITIDLGFADLAYPDGLSIGIVDVPGHEKLVRNMLAGAGGIDIVLLVIAADEGVMPQSREHLHICDLLRIKSGIVVITKTDMVEPEWLALVQDEVRRFVRGSFLEGAEIVPVSAKTGEGLVELKEKIHALALAVQPKPTRGIFRLPVDRVFTLKGFGTVVTGTAVSGTVSVEDALDILPEGAEAKVRGLQSHGRQVRTAYAGQRVAVNLQGIEKESVRRGDTLAAAGRLQPTRVLDAKISLLPEAPPLKNRKTVHLHIGTSEAVARVVLHDRDHIEPGESVFCQLRLDVPVVSQSGDRFIIRRFSPVETIGGGEVLDPTPPRRKRSEGRDDLAVFETGTLTEKIAVKVRRAGLQGIGSRTIEGWINSEIPAVSASIDSLAAKKIIVRLGDLLMHAEAVSAFRDAAAARLKDYHEKNPLKPGMPKEELRTALRIEDGRVFAELLATAVDVVVEKDTLRLKSFSAAASSAERDEISAMLLHDGFQPRTPAELAAASGKTERRIEDVLKLMHKEGSVVRISGEVYLSREYYDRMLAALRAHFGAKADMTVAEFRDLLGTSRKYALPYLEYLDGNRITLRVGDVRKLLLK